MAFGEKKDRKDIPVPPGEDKLRSSFPEHLQKGPPIKTSKKKVKKHI